MTMKTELTLDVAFNYIFQVTILMTRPASSPLYFYRGFPTIVLGVIPY